MAKKVSIITINYNGKDDTVDLIESFGRYETYPYEIIIIDNGSKITANTMYSVNIAPSQ